MIDTFLDKIPKQEIDAEESLISALLINNENYYDLDELRPDHFYKSAHQIIFNAIITLINQGQPADLVTVVSLLKEQGKLEQIGGAAYIAAISDSAPVATNAKKYGDIIRKAAVVRNGTNELLKLVDKGFSNPNSDDFISEVQRVALGLETADKDTILSGQDIANLSINRIEKALTSPESDGLSTGFFSIDEIVNISGSKLILIAARPKIGKTSLMTSMIRNMCDFGYTVGCLSLEMDEEEITKRWIGELGNINPGRLKYSGGLDRKDLQSIHQAHNQIASWNLFLDDHGGNIDTVERKCRKLKKLGCQIIFIDQLSKISGVGKATEVYSNNTSRLAILKKELRIPIVLLCQINREGTEKPTMGNLKQTGMLEEDADMIFILHRKQGEPTWTDCMLVAHRQGGVQDFELEFTANRMTFNKMPSGK